MKSLKQNILGHYLTSKHLWCTCLMFLLLGNGCKKFVTVDNVPDNILSSKVYNSLESANSGINGIYRTARDKVVSQTTLSLTIQTGMYADEFYNTTPVLYLDQYRDNNLLPNATDWSGFYSTIYGCNAAIEGLSGPSSILDKMKQQFIGEAKFLRALSYFYLVNLFGDVPLITSSNIELSESASRSSTDAIYNLILDDLNDALNKVSSDYSISSGDRVRANKATVQALLARVYLYQKNYEKAESLSNAIIESGAYRLVDIKSLLYAKNNSEAIFQFDNTDSDTNQDAVGFIFSLPPSFLITESLSNVFEPGDQRKVNWFKSFDNEGKTYFIPNKFTSTTPGASELNTPFRLGEQYLIRAEARIQLGRVNDGIHDLNILRTRASQLPPNNLIGLPDGLTKGDALLAVERERRIELSCDLGHRFFDLKRTGRINAVMALEKPNNWKSTASLYPIPLADILRNSNLKQNPGY